MASRHAAAPRPPATPGRRNATTSIHLIPLQVSVAWTACGYHHGTVRKKWDDLHPRTRRIILVGALVDGAAKAAALLDLKQRPADEVRGSKSVWATTITLVNSAGILPLVYFLRGRVRR